MCACVRACVCVRVSVSVRVRAHVRECTKNWTLSHAGWNWMCLCTEFGEKFPVTGFFRYASLPFQAFPRYGILPLLAFAGYGLFFCY